jgi:hypothetical protein
MIDMKIQILGRTGPKSTKGKTISSLNAVEHGGYAKTKTLPFESADERKRLERELYRAFDPKDGIEEDFVDRMADHYWARERFMLRLTMKQEAIFGQLTPRALAQLIHIPEVYQPFASDYLKEPNTKFSKKELQRLGHLYADYQHVVKNSKGIQNYQMVFGAYKDIFNGLHDYVGLNYKVPLLNHDRNGIQIAWQQQPKKVEEALLEYAAHLYYKLHFEALRPAIRVAMSSWFFLERTERRESDLQDEIVIKEISRYQACLTQLLSYRKARLTALQLTDPPAAEATRVSASERRNEIPNSPNQSTA